MLDAFGTIGVIGKFVTIWHETEFVVEAAGAGMAIEDVEVSFGVFGTVEHGGDKLAADAASAILIADTDEFDFDSAFWEFGVGNFLHVIFIGADKIFGKFDAGGGEALGDSGRVPWGAFCVAIDDDAGDVAVIIFSNKSFVV